MRTSILLLSLLAVTAGCRKRYETGGLEREEVRPETQLGCPDATVELGARPPDGYDLWCARTLPSGAVERHGPSRTWWPDGTPRSAGSYAGDERDGHWWYWTANGELEREGPYVKGREEGYWLVYEADGDVLEEGPMRAGRREGTWVYRDPKTGASNEGVWVDGEREGVWIEYDADGKPLRERVYRRGALKTQREYGR